MIIEAIICANDATSILKKMKELVDKDTIIKSMEIIEQNKDQIVILISDTKLTKRDLDIWWAGYRTALS